MSGVTDTGNLTEVLDTIAPVWHFLGDVIATTNIDAALQGTVYGGEWI